MRWPRFFTHAHRAREPVAVPIARAELDPRKFDVLGNDLSPLTKRVRRGVIAARKADKTAALERVAAARRATKNLNHGATQ